MGPDQEGNVWFLDGGNRVGPFMATLDQLEPSDPPFLQVAKGGPGYPPGRDFTGGSVDQIHFEPVTSGDAQTWTHWKYGPGMMFDRFDSLS